MVWWILGKLIVPYFQFTLENIFNFRITKKKVLSNANVGISMINFLNMMVEDEKLQTTVSYKKQTMHELSQIKVYSNNL